MTRRVAWAAAAVFVVAFVGFACTGTGQRLDNRIWGWTTGSLSRDTQAVISFAVRRIVPVVAGVILLLHSLIRRSSHLLLVGVVAWAVTTGAAFVLREVLPRPILGDNGGKPINSYPSTHVALAVTPIIVLLLLGAVRRELEALYGLVVVGVMLGNTMLLVHRFSDGIGSVALAVVIASLIGPLSYSMNRRRDRHTWRR